MAKAIARIDDYRLLGDQDDTPALSRAIGALPQAGGRLIAESDEYVVSSSIVFQKSIIIEGQGEEATTFTTTSATDPVFVPAFQGCGLFDLRCKTSVPRGSGAYFIGTAGDVGGLTVERVRTYGGNGIAHSGANFITLRTVRCLELPTTTGVGVKVDNGAGIYVYDSWMVSADLTPGQQAKAGIWLAHCGEADLHSSQCLATGYGMLMERATTISIADWLNDHCMHGTAMLPGEGQSVNVIQASQFWNSASYYYGIWGQTYSDGSIGDIDLHCRNYSNGKSTGHDGILFKVGDSVGNKHGACGDIQLRGSFGDSGAANIRIGAGVDTVQIGGMIGNALFPNPIGVALDSNCSNVRASNAIFKPHSTSKWQNGSTGTGNAVDVSSCIGYP